LLAGAAGANGDLGGVEEFGGFSDGEDFEDHAVSDAGDEGIDGIGIVGEEGHGLTPGEAAPAEGLGGVVVAGVVALAGAVVGVEAVLDSGFRSEHGWFLS
jgi:hypothetical protein